MGIFDDAIREHLELMRQTGADDEELKELEDEAFGLPARPGDPDFPNSTSEEAAVEGEVADGAAEGAAPFDAKAAEGETLDDAVIEAPAQEEPALTPLDAGVEADAEEPPAEPASDELEVPAEPVESPEPEPEDVGSSFTTEEREAIADQPTVFFEQQAPAELELGDLDLDLDEEIDDAEGAASEPLTDEEPLIVEEAFAEEPAAETHAAEPPRDVEPEPADEPEPPGEPTTSDFAPPAEAAEPGTSEEDVLEETPEFLRDNPDDDELWFEQGEPKDFDF